MTNNNKGRRCMLSVRAGGPMREDGADRDCRPRMRRRSSNGPYIKYRRPKNPELVGAWTLLPPSHGSDDDLRVAGDDRMKGTGQHCGPTGACTEDHGGLCLNSAAHSSRRLRPSESRNETFDSISTGSFEVALQSYLSVITPDSRAHTEARLVVEDVRNVLLSVGLQVQLFGSWSTGLCIPTSDMDFAAVSAISSSTSGASIFNTQLWNLGGGGSAGIVSESLLARLNDSCEFKRAQQRNYSEVLRIVARGMRNSGYFRRIVCISHARVPIVKAIHSCGKAVDVSFRIDGPQTSAFLCEELKKPEFRLARGLIMLLKALLSKWGLNDPSRSGLGSFPASIMVLWFLREEAAKECSERPGSSYAVHFVALLKYYGMDFDYFKQGLDYSNGCTFPKTSTDLFIMNPLKQGTNCASAATLFESRIVPVLRGAYTNLACLLTSNVGEACVEKVFSDVFGISSKALSEGKKLWRDKRHGRSVRNVQLAHHQWDESTGIYQGNPIGTA